MSPNLPEASGRERLVPMPTKVVHCLDACTAIDSLSVSLQSLQMALGVSEDAIGLLGLPGLDGTTGEACELRARWLAYHLILRAVADAVERDGQAVIGAVKTMLALE